MPVNKFQVKKNFRFLLTGAMCLFSVALLAQKADTTVEKPEKPQHVKSKAGKAMLYAAICPGLGQIYNKKYWKLPIVYGGLGTAIYFVFFNQHYYSMYNTQLTNYNANAVNNIYSTSELSDLITYYHNDRDLSVIIAIGVYFISIVDANVDAQMRGFNVSDDISLRFTPNFLPGAVGGTMVFVPGFTLIKKL